MSDFPSASRKVLATLLPISAGYRLTNAIETYHQHVPHSVLKGGALHICVCVFVPFIGGSPSVQGETCAALCSVSCGLHLFSVFSVQLEPTGVTQEGVNTRAFFFFLRFLYAPPSSCSACLNFLSREGFGHPCPSPTPKSNFVYSRSFSAVNRFPLPGTKVRKKPTLAEIRTRDLVARRLRGYQLDHIYIYTSTCC